MQALLGVGSDSGYSEKTTTIIKNSDNFWRREAEKVFPIPLHVCSTYTFFFCSHFIKVFNRNRHQLRAMLLNGAFCASSKMPDNWAVHILIEKKEVNQSEIPAVSSVFPSFCHLNANVQLFADF